VWWVFAVGFGWTVTVCGCVHSAPRGEWLSQVPLDRSPRPEIAPPGEAWRRAQAYVGGREYAEVVLGVGESMEPLYRGRTLLVIERQRFETLAPGMTVVFAGDGGWPVAHVLVRPVQGGWEAAGVANTEQDATRVTTRNYRGTVTKAFELTWSRDPEAAAWSEFRDAADRSGTANLVHTQ
jgi:hypothetical protein